ncbi:hypothetical protein MOQ_007744 [Trypanosoma cruzi marinkellei]|uniref:Uncharacterized protein n=1 Tax=Trypanosoma cruzi marinkellei TaxID=85056 RepID=K2MN02_TRYCR|nr:hypothetical protein MOQ_007744 [Trypanosoma cruzi marinkellei]
MGEMFSSVWASEDNITRQCIELVLVSAIGVLLYYVPLCFFKQQRNSRALVVLEPTAKAAAAGVVLYSCFGMAQPHFPGILQTYWTGTPSPDALYFIAGAALGYRLVLQVNHYFDDTGLNATTTAMMAHSVAEGAGLGLIVGSPGFPNIFRHQLIHGVSEGMLMAMVGLERYGLKQTMHSAIIGRLAQAIAYYATAIYMPSVSEDAMQVAEGVALGSMAAMVWGELVQPAYDALGSIRTLIILLATAGVCHHTLV